MPTTRSSPPAASTSPAPRGNRSVATPADGRIIARLIHLNGPPGSGKSTVARRWLDDHPLALLIEIDEIRMRLGRRSERHETKLMVRSPALSLAREQLEAGHDVIVPQYLGRLDIVAGECGAEFVEFVLLVDVAVAADRFRARRTDLSASRAVHPEADVSDTGIERAVDDAVARLERIARSRARCRHGRGRRRRGRGVCRGGRCPSTGTSMERVQHASVGAQPLASSCWRTWTLRFRVRSDQKVPGQGLSIEHMFRLKCDHRLPLVPPSDGRCDEESTR